MPIIQRKEIDYGSLAWSDFQGPIPKKTSNEAVTASDIHDPKVAEIKAEEPVVSPSEKECGKEGLKGFKAKIEYDTSKIEVKSYMDQDSSWKKPWTTEASARETKCQNQVVTPCNTKMAAQEKKALATADAEVKKCEKDAAKLKDGSTLIYECGGKEIEIAAKDECSAKLKSCFEKEQLGVLSWTYTAHTGDSLSASKKADCDTSVMSQCKSSLMPNLSADLLAHEQGHFDITHEIARQIEKQLREKAESFTTEAEGCTAEEAIQKAKQALKAKKPADAFKKIWKDGKKKLKDTQKKYDNETKHSVLVDKQNDWNEKIAAGEI